jgi:flagellar basal-body rod protein FlgB
MKQLFIFSLILIESLAFGQTVNDLNDELKYMAAREMVLSKNLANIDTPGYKPKDIRKQHNSRESIGLRVTHNGHIGLDQNLDFDLVEGEIIEIKPNGNAVTAENELAKKSENSIKFSKTSNLVNSIIGMTKISIGQ